MAKLLANSSILLFDGNDQAFYDPYEHTFEIEGEDHSFSPKTCLFLGEAAEVVSLRTKKMLPWNLMTEVKYVNLVQRDYTKTASNIKARLFGISEAEAETLQTLTYHSYVGKDISFWLSEDEKFLYLLVSGEWQPQRWVRQLVGVIRLSLIHI